MSERHSANRGVFFVCLFAIHLNTVLAMDVLTSCSLLTSSKLSSVENEKQRIQVVLVYTRFRIFPWQRDILQKPTKTFGNKY